MTDCEACRKADAATLRAEVEKLVRRVKALEQDNAALERETVSEEVHRLIGERDSLRAELTASESLVTALQEQMSRLAEQHAKAVAEAREETREACAMTIDPSDTLFGPEAEQFVILARLVRATPLDSTPLAARVEELEALLKTEKEWTAAFKKDAEATAEYELKWNTERRRADAAEFALAAEVERHQATMKALSELADIVQGHLDEGNRLDSFTLQPARRAIASLPAGPREER